MIYTYNAGSTSMRRKQASTAIRDTVRGDRVLLQVGFLITETSDTSETSETTETSETMETMETSVVPQGHSVWGTGYPSPRWGALPGGQVIPPHPTSHRPYGHDDLLPKKPTLPSQHNTTPAPTDNCSMKGRHYDTDHWRNGLYRTTPGVSTGCARATATLPGARYAKGSNDLTC